MILRALVVAAVMLNPAVTQQTIGTTVCVVGWSGSVRHVTPAVRRAAFTRAGIVRADWAKFELDHLVPLSLGGSNSLANLRPVPLAIAQQQDGLERGLHSSVCAHRVSLAEARARILAVKGTP